MSKPFTNPFFETDISKMFADFKMPAMSAMPTPPMVSSDFWMNAQRKNIEALTALNQATMENMQSLAARQAELARQMVEGFSEIMRASFSASSPEDRVLCQAEASKTALEKAMANARDITQTLTKCNEQAMQTISSRLVEGVQELRSAMTKQAA